VKTREVPVKRLLSEQADNSHYFSDEFQPLLSTEGFFNSKWLTSART
jgi:DNA-nicking Smr family endonuclease